MLDIWGLFGVSPKACLIPLCPLLSMLPTCRVGSSVADVFPSSSGNRISLSFSPILFIANLTQRSSGKPVDVVFLVVSGFLRSRPKQILGASLKVRFYFGESQVHTFYLNLMPN